jgi:hypothetical protein
MPYTLTETYCIHTRILMIQKRECVLIHQYVRPDCRRRALNTRSTSRQYVDVSSPRSVIRDEGKVAVEVVQMG